MMNGSDEPTFAGTLALVQARPVQWKSSLPTAHAKVPFRPVLGRNITCRAQPFQTIRTRITSQISATTPPIMAIRPRSTCPA